MQVSPRQSEAWPVTLAALGEHSRCQACRKQPRHDIGNTAEWVPLPPIAYLPTCTWKT